jgi:hypothetical protein
MHIQNSQRNDWHCDEDSTSPPAPLLVGAGNTFPGLELCSALVSACARLLPVKSLNKKYVSPKLDPATTSTLCAVLDITVG